MNPTLTSSPQKSMRRAIPRKRDALPNLHFQYLSIKRSDKTYHPATEKIFYNPELLECILSHFSPRDLLVTAPLVSQLWKSIVESSPTLQIKLGFRARKQNPSSHDSSCLEPKINPLLLWAFHPFFRLDCKCGDKGIRSLTLNDFRRLDWNRSEKRREAYARKEASWRRMVVCQPPIETVIVSRTYALGGRTEEHEGLLMVGEGGLRMGALWDEAQGAAERDRVLDFTLRWGMKGCCEHSESSREGSEDEDDDVKKGKARDELTLRIDHWVDLYSSGWSHNTLESGFESEAFSPLEIVWTGSDNNPDVSPNANHEHYEHLTGAILPSIVLWPVDHVPAGAYSTRTQQVWVGHGRRRHLIHLRDWGH